MENNENNFEHSVNDVQNNIVENKNGNEKKDIIKTVVLLAIVLILVLAVGIGAVYLMSKNGGNANKNASSTNNANQNINQSVNEIEVIKVVSSENSARQMIVEGKDKNNNSVWTYTTPIENVPQEVINRGQKLIETRKGKVYLCDWGRLFILDEQTGKVLAKNTEHNIGAAAVYTFDENDNLYTTSYLAAVDKFDTNANLLKTTESKIWDKGFYWPQKMTLNGNNLVIDYGQEGVVTVNKETLEIIDAKKNTNTNNTVSYFEQNKNINYSSNPKDSINGKVAIIKMGEKTFQTTKHDGYYTYTDNFSNSYNIKEITNITSEYRMTSNDGSTNLFRAVIEYVDNNNAKKSFDTAVLVPNDANNYATLSINGPYENYTGSTSFVRNFTDLYDDGLGQSAVKDFVFLNFKNTVYESERKNGERYYKISFDENGNPSIFAETVGVEYTALKLDKTSVYNVKEDVAAGTVYITFNYEGTGGSGRITYSNVSDNNSIYLKLLDGTNNNDVELKKIK